MQHSRTKVFFIGFNKTATTAFHNLFLENGYKSAHNHIKLNKKINIGKRIFCNLQNNFPILHSIDTNDVYSDLGGSFENKIVEGCFFYRELHYEYPESYFILQTRSKKQWLASRKKWRNLPQRHADILGITKEEVVLNWSKEWDLHHYNVRSFFRNKKNFLEFNIEKDNINNLINFLSKDYYIRKEYWKKRNVST